MNGTSECVRMRVFLTELRSPFSSFLRAAGRAFLPAVLCASLLLPSCSPTYPKEHLPGAIEQLIKKEHNINGRTRLVGNTLYLTIELPELAAQQTEIPKVAVEKLQAAVLSLVRASLSSDANIKFLVVSASVSDWKLTIRIVQMIDDIKGFLYQRISKGDYEERMILDIVTEDDDMQLFAAEEDLTTEKFIAMLIISQVNKLTRMNPFVGAVLKNAQLRYDDIVEGNLIIKVSSDIPDSVGAMLKNVVYDQAEKVLPKYKIWRPYTITLIDRMNKTFYIDMVDASASFK